jgi:hypothetical protein
VATSRILVVGDALVELIKTFLPAGGDWEVKRTYFARRFDAAKTVGRRVYVVALTDVMGDRSVAGQRQNDPLDYMFGIVVAERMPTDPQTWDEKDAWVDDRVDFTTVLRDRLQNMRYDPMVKGAAMFPIDTGERQVVDIDVLVQHGVFFSEFTNTVREI